MLAASTVNQTVVPQPKAKPAVKVVSVETDLDQKCLEAFLKEFTLRPGITIHDDTEEKPQLIFDKKISEVLINSAWIAFTAGSVTYRTKTIEDRNKFYEWYQSDNPKPFSKIKGQETKFGPPDVIFTKVCPVGLKAV